MLETLTGRRPPQTPENFTAIADDYSAFERWCLLKARYFDLSSKDQIPLIQGPQEVQITPGVGENSQLEGTGFILPKELKRLFENYNQNVKLGKTPKDAWVISVDESILNIRTFVVEYIQSSTVLPHKNKVAEVNGENRMVGDNGVPVMDGIVDEERQGGVKEASLIVDHFMSTKAPNRVAIINSPLGHSGLFKKNGSGITYKNN